MGSHICLGGVIYTLGVNDRGSHLCLGVIYASDTGSCKSTHRRHKGQRFFTPTPLPHLINFRHMGWLRPPYRRDQCPEGPVLEGSPPPFQYPSSQNPTPLKPGVEEGISAQGTLPPLTTTDEFICGYKGRNKYRDTM